MAAGMARSASAVQCFDTVRVASDSRRRASCAPPAQETCSSAAASAAKRASARTPPGARRSITGSSSCRRRLRAIVRSRFDASSRNASRARREIGGEILPPALEQRPDVAAATDADAAQRRAGPCPARAAAARSRPDRRGCGRWRRAWRPDDRRPPQSTDSARRAPSSRSTAARRARAPRRRRGRRRSAATCARPARGRTPRRRRTRRRAADG